MRESVERVRRRERDNNGCVCVSVCYVSFFFPTKNKEGGRVKRMEIRGKINRRERQRRENEEN